MASDLESLDLCVPSTNNEDFPQYPQNIQRFNVNEISYNDFYWLYMERNIPVILEQVSSNWECRNWINTETVADPTDSLVTVTNNKTSINYDYLKERIDNTLVPVANCAVEYFNSHAKSEMLFYDFLKYWQEEEGNAHQTNPTEISNRKGNSTDLLYLKDWHLKAQNSNYDFYKVPKHFASDWLNEHLLATNSDDYRFVYMGPKGTWTPFHSDVFGSFSWSTNIIGIKKWLLMPPGEELKLADRLGNLPFSINEQLLEEHNVHFYTLMQKENESLFVPSGWYHQVTNITDTISVNHNWFNACNLERIWTNLSQQMQRVVTEIDDCRQMDNFTEHCQTMLRASFGINYLDFIQLLQSITERRLSTSSSSSKLIFFDNYIPNDYHIEHDLQRIVQVVDLMLQDSVICDDRIVLYRKCIQLKETLNG
ncbi:2-oxoglutarate and iron-dependent oxygenase JMJD4 homolog [Musca vetustissima]|uniref:2-oxoglutarate and iron-dependent oxygenase JMJD4 homolog n=1 Tax=Musca vetustissima TaxID=27455 RepID=UPI002AB76C11|nr:2-oxoglutarate and iron-dependent oxygenase JMJD4 homolog [Musca vetustissima]